MYVKRFECLEKRYINVMNYYYYYYYYLETVIHAFITSCLDYCNSLYCGLPQTAISCLRVVQNAAARLLTGTKKRDHISQILASLHWLPVKFRIDFKIAVFVYKALSGLAPKYILLIPYSP